MDENLESKIERLIENGYSFDIGDYISRGFSLYKISANAMLPFSLIYIFVLSFLSSTLVMSLAISIFVTPCVVAGFYISANKALRGTPPLFVDCFEGFRMFGDVVVVSLVANVLSSIGLFFLIIPGIYLTVAYTFAIMFVIFFKVDLQTALRLSRKVIHCNWWKMFGLFIVAALIGISGTILCGIGVAFTLPMMYCILYVAFEDIVGKAII